MQRGARVPAWAFFPVFLCVFLMGGVVYGYQALLPVLEGEGMFRSLCSHNENSCSSQGLRLGLMYTISVFAMSFCGPVWGELVDRRGGRFALLSGTLVYVVSLLLLSAAENDWARFSGFVGLGLAAPCIYIACVTSTKMRPDLMAPLNAFLTGAFDVSSLLFYFVYLLYEHAGVGFRSIGIAYALVTAAAAAVASRVLPTPEGVLEIQRAFDEAQSEAATAGRHGSDQDEPLLLAVAGEGSDYAGTGASGGSGSGAGDARDDSLAKHLFSPFMIGTTVFMAVLNLKNGFYITTFRDQMEDILPGSASSLVHFFNVAFPVGGALSVPLIGYLLHRLQKLDHAIFAVVLATTLLHALLNLIPSEGAQYAAVLVFSFARSAKWSANNDFVCKRFPLKYTGRLLGVPNMFIGTVGLLLYLCLWLTSHELSGHVFWVLVALTALEFACWAFPVALFRDYTRRSSGNPGQEEADLRGRRSSS